jgi:hypothetical protein
LANEKTPAEIAQDQKEARKQYLQRPKHFAESFLDQYGSDIEHFPLVDQLKVFYVFSGCANQFSVSDYIRKLKEQQQKAKK